MALARVGFVHFDETLGKSCRIPTQAKPHSIYVVAYRRECSFGGTFQAIWTLNVTNILHSLNEKAVVAAEDAL